MTFRAWCRRQLLELLVDPPASPPPPPTSSPASSPSSPTQNGKISASSSAELAMFERMLGTLAEMQRENLREVRGMVMDILQGREYSGRGEDQGQGSTSEEIEEEVRARKSRFDPPDYDAPGTEDLPEGIAGVWDRHDMEDIHMSTSMSPGELLNAQLERARQAAGMDPQGPSSVPSFSTDSLGLQWPSNPQT